jgi:hypothetical protein
VTGLTGDVRYALLGLLRAPVRPMPVPHNERLIRIFTSNPSREGVIARGYRAMAGQAEGDR